MELKPYLDLNRSLREMKISCTRLGPFAQKPHQNQSDHQ